MMQEFVEYLCWPAWRWSRQLRNSLHLDESSKRGCIVSWNSNKSFEDLSSFHIDFSFIFRWKHPIIASNSVMIDEFSRENENILSTFCSHPHHGKLSACSAWTSATNSVNERNFSELPNCCTFKVKQFLIKLHRRCELFLPTIFHYRRPPTYIPSSAFNKLLCKHNSSSHTAGTSTRKK